MVIIQLSLLSNAIRHIKPAKCEYFNPDLLKGQNTHTHTISKEPPEAKEALYGKSANYYRFIQRQIKYP